MSGGAAGKSKRRTNEELHKMYLTSRLSTEGGQHHWWLFSNDAVRSRAIKLVLSSSCCRTQKSKMCQVTSQMCVNITRANVSIKQGKRPSCGRSIALRSTQHVTEMCARGLYWV